MIRVVFFDLGLTLLDQQNQPFPHVLEALDAAADQDVATCLVSDFDMSLSTTDAMTQYLGILDSAGVQALFKPVDRRVTLSNHAGVGKPHRKIFQKALERLGQSAVPFTNCLFVTENTAHINSARTNLGMTALQFGQDFTDWSEFPLRLAELRQATNFWLPISISGHADLTDILVQVPAASAEHVAEVRSFVESLASNGRIDDRPGQAVFQPTHQLEKDAVGVRRLVRKRFTARGLKG